MNKNNVLNRGYIENEKILKKISSSSENKNVYSGFFNVEKKASPSISFNSNEYKIYKK